MKEQKWTETNDLLNLTSETCRELILIYCYLKNTKKRYVIITALLGCRGTLLLLLPFYLFFVFADCDINPG